MNQTYRNLEIILVDDGSPDNCPAICDEWAKRDERIRVIHKENGGLSSARNAGLDVMKGEYVSMIDSDDFILPDMYETLCRLMIENDADLGISGYLYTDEYGAPLQREENNEENDEEVTDILSGNEALRKFITSNKAYENLYYLVIWNKLYGSHIFRNLRFFDGSPCEDDIAVHHILGECRRAAATHRKFYMYTQREDSIMANSRKGFNVRSMTDILFAFKDRYDYLAGKGMIDLAHKVLRESYVIALNMLRQGNYVKHFREFNHALIPLSVRYLTLPGIKMKLRPAKFVLEIFRNIIRNIYHQ